MLRYNLKRASGMFPVYKKYETEMCTTNTYEIQGQGMYCILNVNCKQLARPIIYH